MTMNLAPAKRLRWTVKDYFRMSEAGLFDGRRVELLEGEIIRVPAQGHLHRVAITKISGLLLPVFTPNDWPVIQGTFVASKRSAPDPDFHIFDVPVGTPDDQLPTPILVIEVSDTTYPKDSGPKLRMYARAGVPDYWIVNLLQERIEVYRQPHNPTGKRSGWRYAEVRHYGRGSEISPLRRPRLSFPVDKMLP
jgi:Uma2 family endonuclease